MPENLPTIIIRRYCVGIDGEFSPLISFEHIIRKNFQNWTVEKFQDDERRLIDSVLFWKAMKKEQVPETVEIPI